MTHPDTSGTGMTGPTSGGATAPASVDASAAPEGALDACFDAAAVGLLVTSPGLGRVVRANPAFAALLGTRPEALVGQSAVELTHPDDRAETQHLLDEFAAGRLTDVTWEKRYLRQDGTTVWAQMTATGAYGPDGTLSYTVITVYDLTPIRSLMQRLESSSTRYRRLVDANILAVTVATEAAVEEANDEFLRLAGTTRTAFEAHGVDWRAITPPEHLPKDYHALSEIRERGACIPFEKEYVWPDGTRVPILVGGALLDREPLRWIAFALDLTERKRAEAERDQLLEEARAARGVAERALAARDALLARITHDLRTPVAASRGYASMMRDGIPVPLPPVYQETVRRLIANQEHMLALIDGLLEFARVTSGRAAVMLETLDVNTLLEGIEPIIAPEIRAAGLTYTCSVPETPPSVRADQVKVTQILVNLVGNAIKFTHPGGHITLEATASDEQVYLAVVDTGVGIPAAELDRIFEPFVQSAVATPDPRGTETPRGYGLGLAISRDLARAMGGELTVVSSPGAGSTFTLALARA